MHPTAERRIAQPSGFNRIVPANRRSISAKKTTDQENLDDFSWRKVYRAFAGQLIIIYDRDHLFLWHSGLPYAIQTNAASRVDAIAHRCNFCLNA